MNYAYLFRADKLDIESTFAIINFEKRTLLDKYFRIDLKCFEEAAYTFEKEKESEFVEYTKVFNISRDLRKLKNRIFLSNLSLKQIFTKLVDDQEIFKNWTSNLDICEDMILKFAEMYPSEIKEITKEECIQMLENM